MTDPAAALSDAAEAEAGTLKRRATTPPRVVFFWLLAASLLMQGWMLARPVSGYQEWREADLLCIARNFCAESANILEPRVDWRGASSGVVEMEFPWPSYVVSWAIAAGWDEVRFGRVFSLLFALAGLPLLYAIVRDEYDAGIARWSVVLYWFSPLVALHAAIFDGQIIFVTLTLLTVRCAQQWARRRGGGWAVLTAAVLALTLLTKLSGLLIGPALAALLWRERGWRGFLRPGPWLVALAGLLPAGLWHLHAHHLFEQSGLTFGIFHTVPRSPETAAMFDKFRVTAAWGYAGWWERLLRRFFFVWLGPPGACAAALAGLALVLRRRGLDLTAAWLLGGVAFVALAPRGNFHAYYQLPIVPPAAVLAVLAGAAVWKRLADREERSHQAARAWMIVLLVCVVAHAGAVVWYRGSERSDAAAFGEFIARQSVPGERIVVLQPHAGIDTDPRPHFHGRRKGWSIGSAQIRASHAESWVRSGAGRVFIREWDLQRLAGTPLGGWLATRSREAAREDGFVLYVLPQPE